MTDTISIEMPDDLSDKLDRIAAAWAKEREEVLLDAMKFFIDCEHENVVKIERARADLDAGRGIPHEEAMRQIDELIDRIERQHALEAAE